MLLFVYLPPNYSPFYNNKHLKCIELLEDVVTNISNNCGLTDFIILADLNAIIGKLSECLKTVEHVNELEEYNEFLSNSVDDTRM